MRQHIQLRGIADRGFERVGGHGEQRAKILSRTIEGVFNLLLRMQLESGGKITSALVFIGFRGMRSV